MANLNYHPAPGLGDLLPGFIEVPQNPISGGVQRPISRVPTIGELIAGSQRLPQNPLMAALASGNPMKPANLNGCGCDGAVSGDGLNGLNGLDLSLNASNPLFLLAGAALVWYLVKKR